MAEWMIGILGGSGLYAMDALEVPQWVPVSTPWGEPSDSLLLGRIHGVRFAFLPRHGRGHRIPPDAINYRANIDALKRVGCTDVVALSAVGSLRDELDPGTFVRVDQFVDRTAGRERTFFGTGLVAHVPMADPVCSRLAGLVDAAAESAGARLARGGTYVAIEGPQFSTRAESRLFRTWGCDVIGMTAMPEARLAREAELPFALLAMVTDFDCWREEGGTVEVSAILAQLQANAGTARNFVMELARSLPAERTQSEVDRALDHALITAADARDPAAIAKLDAVCRRLMLEGRLG